MSVIIHNLGPLPGEDINGVYKYELLINVSQIAIFEHRRSDGLAACLRKAADVFQHKRTNSGE